MDQKHKLEENPALYQAQVHLNNRFIDVTIYFLVSPDQEDQEDVINTHESEKDRQNVEKQKWPRLVLALFDYVSVDVVHNYAQLVNEHQSCYVNRNH